MVSLLLPYQMKENYYKILGVNKAAGEIEIKKAYRRLALKHHPDRNPGNLSSEERFKEIAEAYAVLIDRRKREEYDQYRKNSFRGTAQSGPGFKYASEDFYRDIFHHPSTADFFSELEKEFETQGFRFNEKFFNDLFSRRQNVFFNGIYDANVSETRFTPRDRRPVGRFTRRAEDGTAPDQSKSFLDVIPRTIRKSVTGITSRVGRIVNGFQSGRDLTYRVRISRRDALLGKQVRLFFNRGGETERMSIRIPSGVKNGAHLKLAGMGLPGEGMQKAGDLYIKIKIV
jgi:DnaJ-class molecular chaperone